MPKSTRLGIVSDLHVLSRYALVPPQYRPETKHPASKFYEYVWQCWEHFVAHCPPLDVLIINGDLIEGETPTQRSANDALTDAILDQADACVETLRTLRKKCGDLWVLRGTPFHDQKHFEALELIGERLNARRWSDTRRTGEVLDLKWNGISLNVTHHQTMGWLYLAGGADRMALLACAAEAQGKAPPVDIIVRSHLHQKRVVKAHGKWVILTPGWRIPNPHAIKMMEYYRATESCDLGAILVEVRDEQITIDERFTYKPFKATLRT